MRQFNFYPENVYENGTASQFPNMMGDQTIYTEDRNRVRWSNLETNTKSKCLGLKNFINKDKRCRSVEAKSARTFQKYKPENNIQPKLKGTLRASLGLMRHTESSAKKQSNY